MWSTCFQNGFEDSLKYPRVHRQFFRNKKTRSVNILCLNCDNL